MKKINIQELHNMIRQHIMESKHKSSDHCVPICDKKLPNGYIAITSREIDELLRRGLTELTGEELQGYLFEMRL